MKKKFIIATVVISAITVIVTGCGLKDDTNKTELTTAPVTVETTTMNTENLQQGLKNWKVKSSNMTDCLILKSKMSLINIVSFTSPILGHKAIIFLSSKITYQMIIIINYKQQ